jgi:ubiquinone/menaquinone biosynthesis C-methylase UbiE
MDFSLSGGEFRRIRSELLADVKGDVLEVGFGTGLNLPHYPSEIRHITTVDPNPGVHRIARRRLHGAPIQVEHHQIGGENLPLDDGRFDSVVCTFTLCSVPDVRRVLHELHRVMRPGGKLFFAEHGLADDPRVQRWQHWLTPIQRRVGDGCHLNRDARKLITDHGFLLNQIETFYLRRVPRILGFMYRGVAVRP